VANVLGLHRYKLRLLFDAVEMRWDWPVDVNYHEAKAYCAWKAAQVKHAGTNAVACRSSTRALTEQAKLHVVTQLASNFPDITCNIISCSRTFDR